MTRPELNGKLHEHKNPLPKGVYPETDESMFLILKGIRLYQMLMGMAQ